MKIRDGVDFRGSHTVILGGKGSGKSNYLQAKLREDRHAANLVYDTVREHDRDHINRYIPDHRRGDEAEAEFDRATARLVLDVARERRPEVYAVDEATRYMGTRIPDAAGELIDLSRHYGVGFVLVARRPARLHADAVELADRLVVFNVRGTNDKRRLDEEFEGLSETVVGLGEYEYAVVDDRGLTTHDPAPEEQTTAEL